MGAPERESAQHGERMPHLIARAGLEQSRTACIIARFQDVRAERSRRHR
jgi:hypothetical protein